MRGSRYLNNVVECGGIEEGLTTGQHTESGVKCRQEVID